MKIFNNGLIKIISNQILIMGVSSSTNRSTYHLRDDNNTKLCMMATSDMTNSSVSFGPCPQGFSVMKEKNGVRSFEGGDTMKEWKTVKGTGKRGPCPDGWKLLANGNCYGPERYEGGCPRLGKFNGYTEKEKAQWSSSCKAPWTPFKGEKVKNVESGYCVGTNENGTAILTNCSKPSSNWSQKPTRDGHVKLVNPETNKCIVAKTYEAAQLGDCSLPTAEFKKVTTSTQSGTKFKFDAAWGGREFTSTHSDNLQEFDTGAASRSGICNQNPSLMTRNDLKDSINFCQRYQNAQSQEERSHIMREFQITLKGEGGRDGWIPSARTCNDFCYNMATYQSRTNQSPKYLEKAWAKPWNWTACDFDNAAACQTFKDGDRGYGKWSGDRHEFGTPAGCKQDYFEDLCRASGPPKDRKGQSDAYSINNKSQDVWGVKRYHNVCVPGRRRAECERGWYNQTKLRPNSTKCADEGHLRRQVGGGLTGADSACTNTYGPKYIAGRKGDENNKDRNYIYRGGCQGDLKRAQCRPLRTGETKKCYSESEMEKSIYAKSDNYNKWEKSIPGHRGDIICQNENTIHYPAQNLRQSSGGTVPNKGMHMGNVYGRKTHQQTSCDDGYNRLLCDKGYASGAKYKDYTTPCVQYKGNWSSVDATDAGHENYNMNGYCQKTYGWPYYAGYKSKEAPGANWNTTYLKQGCSDWWTRVQCAKANPNIESLSPNVSKYPDAGETVSDGGEGQMWDARIAVYNDKPAPGARGPGCTAGWGKTSCDGNTVTNWMGSPYDPNKPLAVNNRLGVPNVITSCPGYKCRKEVGTFCTSTQDGDDGYLCDIDHKWKEADPGKRGKWSAALQQKIPKVISSCSGWNCPEEPNGTLCTDDKGYICHNGKWKEMKKGKGYQI